MTFDLTLAKQKRSDEFLRSKHLEEIRQTALQLCLEANRALEDIGIGYLRFMPDETGLPYVKLYRISYRDRTMEMVENYPFRESSEQWLINGVSGGMELKDLLQHEINRLAG